jgi:hypothetical protein
MANAHFTPHTDAKFHENPSSGSRVIPLGWTERTDRQTWRS